MPGSVKLTVIVDVPIATPVIVISDITAVLSLFNTNADALTVAMLVSELETVGVPPTEPCGNNDSAVKVNTTAPVLVVIGVVSFKSKLFSVPGSTAISCSYLVNIVSIVALVIELIVALDALSTPKPSMLSPEPTMMPPNVLAEAVGIEVRNPLSLVRSLVAVGTVIFAVLFEVALAVNV